MIMQTPELNVLVMEIVDKVTHLMRFESETNAPCLD